MLQTYCVYRFKGAVSSLTHMLLRIINLKALGQRFQVGIQDGVFKGGRAWSEIRYFRMIKKQRNKQGRRKLCDNQRKRIYLLYNVFKA